MLGLLKRRSAGTAAAEASEHDSVETLSCRFDGSTAEYFEIWLVNLLMTICSLGYFKPWANARKHQYLYSKTTVGRHPLGYWADKSKLKYGALAIPALLISSLAALLLAPLALLAIAAVTVLVYPLYRHHSLQQHAAASGYRGRRFAYTGSVKDSYIRLIAWPVLTVALAFLPLGHSLRSSWGYRHENYNYGDERFSSKLSLARLWGLLSITAVSAVLAVGLVAGGAYALLMMQGGERAVDYFAMTLLAGQPQVSHGLVLLALAVVAAWPMAVWRAGAEQVLCAGVQLEAGVSFDTEISAGKLTGLYLLNHLAILLTLGFAIPWATVRVAKYRASVSQLVCYTDIEELVGDKAAGLMQLKQVTTKVERGAGKQDDMHSALDLGELDLPKAA